MGNCCNGSFSDNDIVNFSNSNQSDKKEKGKGIFPEIQNISKYNTGIDNIHKENTDSNNICNEHSSKIEHEKNLYISKTKLKLIIKQSKCLLEGKEYIINSLGLINANKKNNFQDGLVIFGDINVNNIKFYNYLYIGK